MRADIDAGRGQERGQNIKKYQSIFINKIERRRNRKNKRAVARRKVDGSPGGRRAGRSAPADRAARWSATDGAHDPVHELGGASGGRR